MWLEDLNGNLINMSTAVQLKAVGDPNNSNVWHIEVTLTGDQTETLAETYTSKAEAQAAARELVRDAALED